MLCCIGGILSNILLGYGKGELNIKRLLSWFKAFFDWLMEGKAVLMFFLVMLSVSILGFVTWQSETSIRTAGYALQLIGMIFAIRGLLGIRAHFGQPLLKVLFYEWLCRFPKWKRNNVIGVGAATCGVAVMRARVEVWAPDDPEKSLEERIEAIVRNLDKIRQEQRQNSESIYDLKDSHEEHKKQVQAQTKKLEESLRTDFESLHTSDLVTSLVGLAWLTVGITMSTLAPEIHQWLN